MNFSLTGILTKNSWCESFGILCNLGNQPKLRIQECLSLSLSSIEKKHCQAFYVNFCCAILSDFFFLKKVMLFFFPGFQVSPLETYKFFLKKNKWTSFSFPKNFEGIVIENFTMHMLVFNQSFSELIRKPSTGNFSWGLLCKYTSAFPETSRVFLFTSVALDPVS